MTDPNPAAPPTDAGAAPDSGEAMVVGTINDRAVAERRLLAGEQLTFGRDRAADIRFPDEERLSRIAGTVKLITDGVAIANLSGTHDLFVTSDAGTLRLASTALGEPAASVLLTGGSAHVNWPGSFVAGLRIDLDERSFPFVGSAAVTATGRTTVLPLKLNPTTKEFAVALLLVRPRLLAVPAATATPGVPELTRQILTTMSSFRLLAEFDRDRNSRARLTARIHEHLKSLRDKLIRAKLAIDGESLSPEAIANLLVDHGVLRKQDLGLLDDAAWLTWQEQEWES